VVGLGSLLSEIPTIPPAGISHLAARLRFADRIPVCDSNFPDIHVGVVQPLQLPLESTVKDCREHGVEFRGSLGLELLEGVNFGLEIV